MTLSINTYKIYRRTGNPEYKTYRFACFDSCTNFEGMTFEEKFNKAFESLKKEINQDRENNDVRIYEPIVIADVSLS